VATLSCSSLLSAQQLVVDQSATPESPPQGFLAVLFNGGVGQEFTPTLDKLDFVDLLLLSMQPNDTGTFQLNVREGSLAGPVVGVSQPLWLTMNGDTPASAHFQFSDAISLVPERTYVLEVPHQGPYWGAIIGVSSYDRGRAINLAAGEWPDNLDLWFREGIAVVPEPRVGALAASAILLLLFTRTRRFTFKKSRASTDQGLAAPGIARFGRPKAS
jgi:hypothetical protein